MDMNSVDYILTSPWTWHSSPVNQHLRELSSFHGRD